MINQFQGNICKDCGSTTRFVKTNKCVSCNRKARRNYYHIHKELKGERNRNPIGPDTYGGSPCKKCGTSIRQVRDNRCLNCLRRRQEVYNLKLREASFMQKHGCTFEQREKMYKEQKGKCLICKDKGHIELLSRGTPAKGRLVVDHCHTTGKIRGLICNSCNIGLGVFKDSKEALLNAVAYLEQNS